MAESQATWPFNAVHRSHAVVTSMPVEAQPLDGPAPKHGSDQNNTYSVPESRWREDSQVLAAATCRIDGGLLELSRSR